MIYKFNYTEAVLEFSKNTGRARLEAASPEAALNATRELFDHIRDPQIKAVEDGHYEVSFKVSLDYHLPRLRDVEKAVRMLRNKEMYSFARYIDRYCVAIICSETGHPEWLTESRKTIRQEISSLRKAAIVAREVSNVRDFVDWDIVIYNYIEINSKPGFKSRVVRRVLR
ncbi:MAG: hypothetical protein JSU65_01670 [Candidatus Zixiibacteriota bacterium]|nr:MAG: hypothetical protein JSU65_01670 [candidate division Zixibacteria bacterium]